jgi:hypothetical protein
MLYIVVYDAGNIPPNAEERHAYYLPDIKLFTYKIHYQTSSFITALPWWPRRRRRRL